METAAKKKVKIGEVSESTPLIMASTLGGGHMVDGYSSSAGILDRIEHFDDIKRDNIRRESLAADQLSVRLLQIDDDDSEAEERILRESLNLEVPLHGRRFSLHHKIDELPKMTAETTKSAWDRLLSMVALSLLAFSLLAAALWAGVQFVGPPNQPAGSYQLVERQEGANFFNFYNFYEGYDSAGSNGYITYISEQRARALEIANITQEADDLDIYYRRRILQEGISSSAKTEPFLYLKTAATEKGPRESIRLEGKRRFNRGLFIIDVRHMPSGCGVWPAFWLTDEANWPVNGEIDIVEGINFQHEAKTALHTTKECDMFDVPVGTMTGTWDTAVGIPDKKTGVPDMTFREARNCFVYDPHQWLNQGCVAIDKNGGSLGIPLNKKGGGVFALEWDPIYKHIRTWVFSPHASVPENLVKAIRTAHESEESRVLPDPEEWPIPYGYFPLGEGTNCAAYHFRNMRLVLNTAFCGSVAGNRFQLDCKKEANEFETCNEYIKSEPDALKEAYWKIRGVYVYERSWIKAWVDK